MSLFFFFIQDHLVFPATEYNETQRPKMSFMIMAPPNSKLEFLVTRPSPTSGQLLSGSFPIPSVGISLKRRCNTALPAKWWAVFSEQLHG